MSMDAHETQEFARLKRVEREYIELRRQWETRTVSYGEASSRAAGINSAKPNNWGQGGMPQYYPPTSAPTKSYSTINRKLLLLCN